MKVITIRQKKYEVLEEKNLNKWRTHYILKNLDSDEKFILKIEDYREAEFVVNGKISSVIHKIGDQILTTVLRPENLEFKEEEKIKSKNNKFKFFRFTKGNVERKRHLAKTITWRTVGTLDTILLSYLITGNIKVGFTIGSIEMFTKMILYYLHERTWYKFSKFGVKK
jgi:uncharacterized membrane protein